MIKSGLLSIFWIGIVCASWSRARRAPVWSSWPSPLRGDTPDLLFGLTGLSAKDQQRVKEGNAQVRWLIRILK
eukprot:8387702-Heterocapsa_arctica.AAC.1